MVACALTRQLPPGKVDGKYSVKPRLFLTTFQLVIVVGVPGAGEVVGVTPAVAVVPGVVVADGLAVDEAVGEGTAPSSRNTITGLEHQRSFASGRADGVGVGVDAELPNRPLQEIRKKLEHSNKSIAR